MDDLFSDSPNSDVDNELFGDDDKADDASSSLLETDESKEEDAKAEEPEVEAEGEAEEASEAEDKNVPFHEHPRWKEREEDWQRKLEEATTKAREEALQNNSKQAPEGFDTLYGEHSTKVTEAHSRLINEIVSKQLGEAEQKRVQQEVEQKQYIEKLKTDYAERVDAIAKEHSIDKNKYKAWFLENEVYKQNGDYDLERGALIFKAMQPDKKRVGDIAGKMQSEGTPKTSSGVYTPTNRPAKSWGNLN